jgi:hypothetical protein
LRREEKFQEATSRRGSQDNPNALEPQMELARILQPGPNRPSTDEAFAVDESATPGTAPQKPNEYYEVIYNAAHCLRPSGGPNRSGKRPKASRPSSGSTRR